MIRIEKLRKSFRDGEQTHAVLAGLDLEIEPGEFVALVGRSGSGKSTLLNCIAGIERPDSGHILIGDTRITGLDDRALTRLRRDRIGIVFQFFNLLPTIPVIENVALPALLAGEKRSHAQARALDLLRELGLADRAGELPDHLSGGEQQRVATARALINDPDVLLADEPTGNLDAATGEKTLELLREVNVKHGVTVLMVTHSREAAAVAGRVAVLQAGRVEFEAVSEPSAEEEETAAVVEVETKVDTAMEEPDPAPKADHPSVTGESPKARPSAKAAALFAKKPAETGHATETPDPPATANSEEPPVASGSEAPAATASSEEPASEAGEPETKPATNGA